MSTTITPRIGMRVILRMSHATGRAKREHLPPEFTGVIYAFDGNGADVRFFDHFGVAKEAHDVPLLARADNDGGWTTWCRPAPGEPESMPVDVIDARSIPVETELARVDAIPVRNPCTWDLSVVDTGVLVDEIRKRAPHLAAQPGEDLGCLREKAQAWDGVVQALNDTLGNWLQAGMSAVETIQRLGLEAAAWKAVVKTLDQSAPNWKMGHTPADLFLRPACTVIRQALAVVNCRELSADDARALAIKSYRAAAGVDNSMSIGPSTWVIDAIIAASRGEG